MVSKYHIARRLLKDDAFVIEVTEHFDPEFKKWVDDGMKDPPPSKGVGVFKMVDSDRNKTYVVTDTVLDKLEMLKVKKSKMFAGIEHFDWSVLTKVPTGKFTFIMPNNQCLRLNVDENIMHFIWFDFTVQDKARNLGYLKYHLFFLEKQKGWEPCEHFASSNVQNKQDTVFKLMCFMYLSDVEEVTLNPGEKRGTRKSGKLINDFDVPITIVNSKWNITAIRTEGFGVSGHFALRWAGQGKTEPRVVFIEPFEKKGYVRKAGKLLDDGE